MRADDRTAPTSAGTIHFHDACLSILFDTGATHCFIAEACVARLSLSCTSGLPLTIGLADGAKVRTSREILGCPIHIGEREWPTDLIVMPLRMDDLILGMDFMDHYGAIINMRTRTVSILEDDETEHRVGGATPGKMGRSSSQSESPDF